MRLLFQQVLRENTVGLLSLIIAYNPLVSDSQEVSAWILHVNNGSNSLIWKTHSLNLATLLFITHCCVVREICH